jgi:hypothetical protein
MSRARLPRTVKYYVRVDMTAAMPAKECCGGGPRSSTTDTEPRREWPFVSAPAQPPGACMAGTGLTPPTSAPGLGSPRPHLRRDWAHPAHICAGTGLTPPTSASWDWAQLCCIGTRAGRTPVTSARGSGSPLPHLRRDRTPHRRRRRRRRCRPMTALQLAE